ncbi:hypothetical protein HPB47_020102 [Ixodes persulcatus]|uniref:Uncharacterized protein n=1 Tax=Ixodes persulcatus TaxID=34615 RepID=A0AC60QIY8_IXOPE|nr:hypothetical protein HPB47_020102 [Ixodes persulcatus]
MSVGPLTSMTIAGSRFPLLYGLRDFLVISPSSDEEAISNEDKTRLLVSSVCVALTNSKCPLPVFVQLHHPQERLCYGVCLGSGLTTYFDMVHLSHVPQACSNLSGLLSLFKSKLVSPLCRPHPEEYLGNFAVVCNMRESLDDVLKNMVLEDDLPGGTCESRCLESGGSTDPEPRRGRLHLRLLPKLLPKLRMGRRLRQPSLLCGLLPGRRVGTLAHTPWREHRGSGMALVPLLQHLRGRNGDSNQVARQEWSLCIFCRRSLAKTEILDALDRLAQPNPLSFRLPQMPRPEGALGDHANTLLGNQDLLVEVLGYVFLTADAEPEAKGSTVGSAELDSPSENVGPTSKLLELKESFHSLKTTHTNSLLWRLALAAVHVYHTCGGIEALAQLWVKVVAEIRYYWENNLTLPRLHANTCKRTFDLVVHPARQTVPLLS